MPERIFFCQACIGAEDKTGVETEKHAYREIWLLGMILAAEILSERT